MNDVRRCFDCIIHTIEVLVLQTRTLFETLQTAKNSIKTVYSILYFAYRNKTISTQPTDQGNNNDNGNDPNVWSVISYEMITMMKNKCHGVNLLLSLSYHLSAFYILHLSMTLIYL